MSATSQVAATVEECRIRASELAWFAAFLKRYHRRGLVSRDDVIADLQDYEGRHLRGTCRHARLTLTPDVLDDAWEAGREWAACVAEAQSGNSADHAAEVIRDEWNENPYREAGR